MKPKPKPMLIVNKAETGFGLWICTYHHRFGSDVYLYVGEEPSLAQVIADIDEHADGFEGERPRGCKKPEGYDPHRIRDDEYIDTFGPFELPKPATDLRYATVAWTPHDVKTLRPKWSVQRCEDWLEENAHHIQDRLVESGWDVLSSLIATEPKTWPKTPKPKKSGKSARTSGS